jgi:peptidoglycan/xylan/chitin deacetylase (PgdA/CDA1 family)
MASQAVPLTRPVAHPARGRAMSPQGPSRAQATRPRVLHPPGAASQAGLVPPPPHLPPFWDHGWWVQALRETHWPTPDLYRLAVAAQDMHRPYVAVFVYHQVCPPNWPLRNGPDYITPQRLAQEFAFFDAHHIRTLTPEAFLGFLQGRANVPSGSVFLTFDNGLEGVYRYAFPLAVRYRVHITTFIIGDRTRATWRPGDRFLSWGQIETMAKSGYVGIESETYDLHTYVTVAPHVFAPAVLREWETYPRGHEEPLRAYVARLREAFVAQRLAFWRHLHRVPTLLVWPFSTYNQVAQLEAKAAGYQAAFAVYPGVITSGDSLDRFALPRNPATFMWDDVPAEYSMLQAEYGGSAAAVAAIRTSSVHGDTDRT